MKTNNLFLIGVFIIAIALAAVFFQKTNLEKNNFISFEKIVLEGNLTKITDFKFIPGTEDEFLISEQSGLISHYKLKNNQGMLLGSFAIPNVYNYWDCGLLSLTFDPNFAQNRFVYFGYCISNQFSRISRFVFNSSDYKIIPESEAEIMTVGHPEAEMPWHALGSMGFDNQDNMWALIGEKTIEKESQNLSNNLGSMIRIIPNQDPNGKGYTPAQGNPFLNDSGKSPDIYAYGLRMPWKGYLDPQGRYWIGDVGSIGSASMEEVNLITKGGQNFGWPLVEGPCQNNCQPYTEPLLYWDRLSRSAYNLEDSRTAHTKGSVVWVGIGYQDENKDRYNGLLTDHVLYGDFCLGWVRAVKINDDNNIVNNMHVGHLEYITAWDKGLDGYLYAATYGDSKHLRQSCPGLDDPAHLHGDDEHTQQNAGDDNDSDNRYPAKGYLWKAVLIN